MSPQMDGVGPAFEMMGAFFGIFGFLYFLFILFITVLVIVFIFKAMGFMKRKNEQDRQVHATLEKILDRLNDKSD